MTDPNQTPQYQNRYRRNPDHTSDSQGALIMGHVSTKSATFMDIIPETTNPATTESPTTTTEIPYTTTPPETTTPPPEYPHVQ